MTSDVESVLAGGRRALARAATLIENRTPEGEKLLRSAFSQTGRGHVIGITGAAGAGKSTLTSGLIRVLRSSGKRVGVIAVDPTSPFTGGAILGDRVRMQDHYGDDGVFIRSMATRGSLGGLAPATVGLCLLLDAAGFDAILVETVGVGQGEVDIAQLAAVTAVVLVPHMGDGVQMIKAGLLEIADIVVLNKSDLPGAEQLRAELHSFGVPVYETVASEGTGIAELAVAVTGSRPSTDRLLRQWESRLQSMFREAAADAIPPAELRMAADAIVSRVQDPYSILDNWKQRFLR